MKKGGGRGGGTVFQCLAFEKSVTLKKMPFHTYCLSFRNLAGSISPSPETYRAALQAYKKWHFERKYVE